MLTVCALGRFRDETILSVSGSKKYKDIFL